MKITRENVCQAYGHDDRWRLLVGPLLPGQRRPAYIICLDCGRVVWK